MSDQTQPRFINISIWANVKDPADSHGETMNQERPLTAGACLLQADYSFQDDKKDWDSNANWNGWTEEKLDALEIGKRACLYTSLYENTLYAWIVERVS